MSKTLMSWDEPMFFALRFRTAKEWLVRLLIIAIIATVTILFLRWNGRNFPWWNDILVGLTLGAVLTFIPDLFFMQRELSIDEQGLNCHINAGRFSTFHPFPFSTIASIELIRPEDWEIPPGRDKSGMKVYFRDGSFALYGVARNRKLTTIATILHRLGVQVELQDWIPTTADTRVRVEDELSLANLKATTKDAVFTPLPSEEPKLNPLSVQISGGLVGGGPLLIGLILMVWGYIHLWRHWTELSLLWKCAFGFGSFGVFVLSFMFILYIGQFLENGILIARGREQLRTRISPLLDIEDDDVFPVVLYNREMWTNVISRSADFGFLQVNKRRRAIVFEGDKERWTIPLTALSVVRIEEAQVGSEGNAPSEIRYYVVIGTERDGQPWEIGLSRPRTQFGSDGPEPRKARVKLLFEELRTAMSFLA